jgi:hypothetical protein
MDIVTGNGRKINPQIQVEMRDMGSPSKGLQWSKSMPIPTNNAIRMQK